jgi:hypothetical protein
MVADLTSVSFFAPIAAFLLVFIVVFAVLHKLELIGDSKWANIFVSFLIASVFVSAAGTKDYVLTVIPWIAVLIVSLFFILMLTGFIGEGAKMGKGLGIAVLIILVLIFLVSAFVVFNDVLLLPGGPVSEDTGIGSLVFFDWLYSERVIGALVLIIASAIVTWVLVKSK